MRRSSFLATAALALAGCFVDGGAPPLQAADDPTASAATSAGDVDETSAAATDDPVMQETCPAGHVPEAWYLDGDGDGFGAGAVVAVGCAGPPGAAAQSGDCDDLRPEVHPGADELCNGLRDDDCDGLRDEHSPENLVCSGCLLVAQGGAVYWVCQGAHAFDDAEARCQERGDAVHLASIHDPAEGWFLADLAADQLDIPAGESINYWLGLRRRPELWNDCGVTAGAADWQWLDGTPTDHLQWMPPEPNNLGCDPECAAQGHADPLCPRENCAQLRTVAGDWNDVACAGDGAGYLCKHAP